MNPPVRTRSFLRSRRGIVLAAVLLLALAAAMWLWRPLGPRSAGFVEYPMPVATDIPTALAVAPDGSVWFSIDFASAVGVVRNGKVERFAKATRNTEPIGIAVDRGGKVWVTDASSTAIVAVSTTGEMASVALGTPIARLGRMAAAPDGSVWFAEGSAFSITRQHGGTLTRHAIDSVRGGPYGVAVAADGTVWATLQAANALLRIAPDGKITEHEIPAPGVSPTDVAVDAAGTVWFLQFRADKIGQFRAGRVAEVALPEAKAGLSGLAIAPDGAVWFGMLRRGSIGRLRDGKFAEWKLPRERARPYSVAVDASGNVWYADITGFVGMLPARDAAR